MSIWVPECWCTNCGIECDAASSMEPPFNQRPSPGDPTVCLYCGHLMVYHTNLSLRDPTVLEIPQLAGHPKILLIQRMRERFKDKIAEMKRKHDADPSRFQRAQKRLSGPGPKSSPAD